MAKLVALLGVLSGCWTSQSAKPEPTVEKKRVIRELVQPVYIEKVDEDEEDMLYGGLVGGSAGGVTNSPPPPPPPPPPAPPQNIPPTMLEGNRIAGNKFIVPDVQTKADIAASGKDKVVGSFKLCVDDTGTVSQVTKLKSTGFLAYDTAIETEMQTWQYRPYQVNGKAVPVCTAVTFIYSQTP